MVLRNRDSLQEVWYTLGGLWSHPHAQWFHTSSASSPHCQQLSATSIKSLNSPQPRSELGGIYEMGYYSSSSSSSSSYLLFLFLLIILIFLLSSSFFFFVSLLFLYYLFISFFFLSFFFFLFLFLCSKG